MHVHRTMLIEPVPVPDVYVSGLSHIEDADGNMRFTFFATRIAVVGDGLEYTVEARLVLSRQVVWQAVKATLRYLGVRCLDATCPQRYSQSVH